MNPPLPPYTSPNNAYAWVFYGGQAFLGALIVFWKATVDSLATILFVPFAGAAMLIAGVVGVTAIIIAKRRPTPDRGVALEAHAAAGMFVVNLVFCIALLTFYPADVAIASKVFTAIFWVGGLARFLQIRADRRRFRRAFIKTNLTGLDTTNS